MCIYVYMEAYVYMEDCFLTVAHYMLENYSMSAGDMYFHQLLRYSVMVYISLNRSFQCNDQQISWVCYSTTVVVFHYISK